MSQNFPLFTPGEERERPTKNTHRRQTETEAERDREKVKETKRARALRLSSIIFPSFATDERAGSLGKKFCCVVVFVVGDETETEAPLLSVSLSLFFTRKGGLDFLKKKYQNLLSLQLTTTTPSTLTHLHTDT